jgi:ATP-dependent Lon protease
MRDYRDAKAMARRLREALAEKGAVLGHSECLELIAKSFGLKDWHVLSAMIEAEPPPTIAALPQPAPRVWTGPAVLMRDVVAFPKVSLPIFVGREMSLRATGQALEGEQEVLLVTQRVREDDDPPPERVHAVGVVADVLQSFKLPDGTAKFLVRGQVRAHVRRLFEEDGLRRAEATLAPSAPPGPDAADLVRRAHEALDAFVAAVGKFSPEAYSRRDEIKHPGVLIDLIAAHAAVPIEDKQLLLETIDVRLRLERLCAVLSRSAPKAA